MATRKRNASKRTTVKTSSARQDAIALLRADHKHVNEMFKSFETMKADDGTKAELVRDICNELTVHTTVEEEIFYPAVRNAIHADGLMDEADVEHASAKDLIADLMKMKPGEDHYDAKVTVLGEYIKHHVKEEHDQMFPKVKKSKLDLEQLGAQMLHRKDQLKGTLGMELG